MTNYYNLSKGGRSVPRYKASLGGRSMPYFKYSSGGAPKSSGSFILSSGGGHYYSSSRGGLYYNPPYLPNSVGGNILLPPSRYFQVGSHGFGLKKKRRSKRRKY